MNGRIKSTHSGVRNMGKMSDLSLVPLQEIWDELRKRYDAVVLLDLIDMDKDREARGLNYNGSLYACLGLVKYAEAAILADIQRGDKH